MLFFSNWIHVIWTRVYTLIISIVLTSSFLFDTHTHKVSRRQCAIHRILRRNSIWWMSSHFNSIGSVRVGRVEVCTEIRAKCNSNLINFMFLRIFLVTFFCISRRISLSQTILSLPICFNHSQLKKFDLMKQWRLDHHFCGRRIRLTGVFACCLTRRVIVAHIRIHPDDWDDLAMIFFMITVIDKEFV